MEWEHRKYAHNLCYLNLRGNDVQEEFRGHLYVHPGVSFGRSEMHGKKVIPSNVLVSFNYSDGIWIAEEWVACDTDKGSVQMIESRYRGSYTSAMEVAHVNTDLPKLRYHAEQGCFSVPGLPSEVKDLAEKTMEILRSQLVKK